MKSHIRKLLLWLLVALMVLSYVFIIIIALWSFGYNFTNPEYTRMMIFRISLDKFGWFYLFSLIFGFIVPYFSFNKMI